MRMLCSGKVWQIWRFAMFLSISLPLSRTLTPSLSYHIIVSKPNLKGETFSLFALSELVYSLFLLSELVFTKNVFYPILLFPTFSPQASSPLERYWQTDSCSLNKGFFLLSTRGPTGRRNSTGQAILWGGRPTELGCIHLWTYYVVKIFWLNPIVHRSDVESPPTLIMV